MGVNLPAHLVVLKGTRRYCPADENPEQGRGYKEYDKSACLQMIGRAGRPQFDTEGVAVIMTSRQVIWSFYPTFHNHSPCLFLKPVKVISAIFIYGLSYQIRF